MTNNMTTDRDNLAAILLAVSEFRALEAMRVAA